MTEAKRGDLAVLVTERRDFYIGQPSRTSTTVELTTVTSVSRDGVVLAVRLPHDTVQKMTHRPSTTVMLVSRDRVNAETVRVAAAAQHHYAGHPGQPQPFDSIDEAREFIRPFLNEPKDTTSGGLGSNYARKFFTNAPVVLVETA